MPTMPGTEFAPVRPGERRASCRHRPDCRTAALMWLFGAAFLAYGLTHFLRLVVIPSPVDRLIGMLGLATGLVPVSMAIVLAWIVTRAFARRGQQTMECELRERQQADEAASVRTRQLETLVELSESALAIVDPDVLAEKVAVLTASGLSVGLCGVFQALSDREEFQLKAGIGWRDGLVGSATVPAGIGSLAGFVAQEAGAVASLDIQEDNRFGASLLEREHDAVGGIGVEVNGSDGPHCVLVAYTTRPKPLVLVAHSPRRPFGDDDLRFLRSVAGLLGSNLSRIEARQALIAQASTDILTGLRNVRYLREESAAFESTLRLRRGGISAVMLDIDRFKSYNDSFGHPAGDEILRGVGSILQREARASDLAARCGGEEFAILLPGANSGEARSFAERLRRAIESHAWPLRSITASLGVATCGPKDLGVAGLLSWADRALYVAKRAGRNRVVHCNDLVGGEGAAEPGESGDAIHGEGTVPADARVLHIDDDPTYRRALARHLDRAGFTVSGADTGAEGLSLAGGCPDLILLDIRLPDCDGLDLCRRLKADSATSAIPIVCLSSTLYSGADRALALSSGASAALLKTGDSEELLAVASALIRASQGALDLDRSRREMGSASASRPPRWIGSMTRPSRGGPGHLSCEITRPRVTVAGLPS